MCAKKYSKAYSFEPGRAWLQLNFVLHKLQEETGIKMIETRKIGTIVCAMQKGNKILASFSDQKILGFSTKRSIKEIVDGYETSNSSKTFNQEPPYIKELLLKNGAGINQNDFWTLNLLPEHSRKIQTPLIDWDELRRLTKKRLLQKALSRIKLFCKVHRTTLKIWFRKEPLSGPQYNFH